MRLSKPIVVIAGLLALPLLAQNLSPDKVMDRLDGKIKDAKTLRIAFEEAYIWKLTGETVTTQGTLFLEGERRFRVETEDQIIVSDGETLWTYSRSQNRVLIDKLGENETQMLPRRILFHYVKDYAVQSAGKETLDGKESVRLIFTANTQAVLYPRVELWVNLDTWLPSQVLQEDMDGNHTRYRLLEVNVDVPLPEGALVFQAPEGADVIDMRQ